MIFEAGFTSARDLGSTSNYFTAGHLNFNVELPAMEESLWAYVIAHELLHLFVPNHGRLWKSLIRAHLGDYEAMERRLRQADAHGPVS